ncbi:MAG: LysE family translocator, partial [Rubricella sp.]
YLVTALNPKSIVFFVAFVPQFVDPAAAFLPQVAAMVATFVALAALNAMLWALVAGEMRARIGRPSVLKALARAGGAFLVAAGAVTALARRA